MNTISAVTAVLAAAALGLAGCASGGEETIEVTGTQSNCVMAPDNPGFHGNCVMEASDERVSGTVEVVMDEVGDDDPMEFVGTAVITNDGGTWSGDCTGTVDEDDGFNSFDCDYVGAGGYEGMTYDSHVEGYDYPDTATGTLTEG